MESQQKESIATIEGLDLSTNNPNWKVIDRILGCIYGFSKTNLYIKQEMHLVMHMGLPLSLNQNPMLKETTQTTR